MENIVLGSCFSKISHIKYANVYRYLYGHDVCTDPFLL